MEGFTLYFHGGITGGHPKTRFDHVLSGAAQIFGRWKEQSASFVGKAKVQVHQHPTGLVSDHYKIKYVFSDEKYLLFGDCCCVVKPSVK